MRYTTSALSVPAQLAIWQSKGLTISDIAKAEKALSNINYFRFRAYAHTFQNRSLPARPFLPGASLDDILDLYQQDRNLRLLLLDAIERIEVAFRAQLIQQFAVIHGTHWHEKPALCVNRAHFQSNLSVMRKELRRSSETFIQDYYRTYTRPAHPPSWMSLEVVSFGVLSKMFDNLKNSPEKKAIARHFGLTNHQFQILLFHFFPNDRFIKNRRVGLIHSTSPKARPHALASRYGGLCFFRSIV